MPYVSLRELGLSGLIADRPAYELEANAFTSVSNVRFNSGSAKKTSIPVSRFDIEINASWMQFYLSNDVIERTYATKDKLYDILNGVSTDVSRLTGVYASTNNWQSFIWGESVVYNNGVDVPQIKEPLDTEFKDLPNWLTTQRAKVIRPYKNFMVALNVTDNGIEQPNYLQWSNEAETGQVPNSWVTQTDNLAGGNPLGAEDGAILDGLELGDVFIIYTLTAAYQMQFIGGDFVMGFSKFSDNGLVGVNAVCAYDHYHFCVSKTSVYIHDGHTVQHIADQRVRDFLFNSSADSSQIKCVHVQETKEIFVYFASDLTVDNAANKALIWCYRYNTWSIVDMPNVQCISGSAEQDDLVTYDNITTTYASETRSYSQMLDSSLQPTVYLLSSGDDKIYTYDTEFGAGTDFRLERIGLDFDKLLGSTTNNINYIDQLLPQITGKGLVDISLGFADTPLGAVNWAEPVTYDIETDYKIDVRDSGRYIAWRFEGNGEGSFELSGLDFNVQQDGER